MHERWESILKNVQDRQICSIKCKQEVVCALQNGDIANDRDCTENCLWFSKLFQEKNYLFSKLFKVIFTSDHFPDFSRPGNFQL